MQLGFYIPKGYIIDQSQNYFKEFNITLKYKKDEEEVIYNKLIKGKWKTGELAEVIIPLVKDIEGNIEFNFVVKSILCGSRPYEYSDKLEFEFIENIDFKQCKNISKKDLVFNA